MDAKNEQSAGGPQTAGLSIWARLVLCVLAVAVPMGLLTAGVVYRLTQDSRERQREALVYGASTILRALDARLNQRIAVGRALAASRAVLDEDLTDFRIQAAVAFPDRSDSWVVLADPDGQQIMNLASKSNDPLPRRDPTGLAAQQRAFDSGDVQISGVYVEQVSGKWVTTVEVPIFRNGQRFRVLSIAMSTEAFFRQLNERSLPEGWIAGVVDRDGRLISRSLEHTRFVGQAAASDWNAKRAGTPNGIVDTLTMEGDEVLTANATSALSEWTVGVGSSIDVFEAPIRDIILWANGIGAAVTMSSILLALWVARRISEPVRALERNAAALAAGRDADVRSRVPEIQRVWAAMKLAVVDRARREAALRESEDRFRTLADSAPVLIWVNGRERTEFVNRYYFDFVGESEPDLQDFHILRFMHPEDRKSCLAAYSSAMAARAVFECEFRLRHRDGAYRWMKTTGLPRLGPSGEVIGYVGSTFDVSDIKAREQHIEFIMHELSHRSKNLLAVVHSIARQTARQNQDFRVFEERFTERLRSLSDAHDLLVRHDWAGARIKDIVNLNLMPFDAQRIELKGDDLTLEPEAVQNLALALHELATNASKHGAFSAPVGKVAVSWGLLPDGDPLQIRWVETGGPAVSPPERTGFGSTVLQRVVPQALDGVGTLEYPSAGLVWTLTIPARWIVKEKKSARALPALVR